MFVIKKLRIALLKDIKSVELLSFYINSIIMSFHKDIKRIPRSEIKIEENLLSQALKF